MKLLEREYAKELKILNITLPKTDKIPAVRFDKAKELVAEKYNRKIRNPFDLEPEEETLIGQYFKEEYDADFVFVTHYPSKKRPFYAMDDPEDSRFTLSFDLLYHGLEITTGGSVSTTTTCWWRRLRPKEWIRRTGTVSGYVPLWHAASRWTGYRHGTSDHEIGG